MATVSPERRIENALVSAISALSSVTTISASVRNANDMSATESAYMVRVQCARAERLEPNYNYYRSETEIGCISHVPNDENAVNAESLYDGVNEYVQGTLAISALNTAITDARVTVDGIVPQQNEGEEIGDNGDMRVDVVRADIFYTFVPTT